MLYDVSADPAVRSAVERLYASFARYPLRRRIDGCPHCFSAEDDRRLHAFPLREMPEENLSMFAWKAMTTWGDAHDFKHFFPRLCELSISSQDTLHFGMSLFDRKLKYRRAGYASWPGEERAAFAAFLLAWWQALLARGETAGDLDVRLLVLHQDIDSLSLEQLAAYVDDLRPFLDALLAVNTRGGHAYALATYRSLYWRGEVPGEPFSVVQLRQIAAWLLDRDATHIMRVMVAQLAAEAAGQGDEFAYGYWSTSLPELAADVLALLG